jgi:hypothetical protein
MQEQAILTAINATVPTYIQDSFVRAVYSQMAEDSPNGFVPGGVTIASGNDLPESFDATPTMDFDTGAGNTFVTFGGYFSTGDGLSNVPDGIMVRVYAQDGLRTTSLVQPNGYFSVSIVDIPPGRIPLIMTFSSAAEQATRARNRQMQRPLSAHSNESAMHREEQETHSYPSPCPLWVVNNNQCPPALSLTLSWDGPTSDMDLHVIEPSGKHVWYGDINGNDGFLDVDDADGFGPENYVAPVAPTGSSYTAWVHAYSMHSETVVNWILAAKSWGKPIWTEQGTFDHTGELSPEYIATLMGSTSRFLLPFDCGGESECPPSKYPWYCYIWWCDDEPSEAWKWWDTVSQMKFADGKTREIHELRGLVAAIFAIPVGKDVDAQSELRETLLNIELSGCRLNCVRDQLLESFCYLESIQESKEIMEVLERVAASLEIAAAIGAGETIEAMVTIMKIKLDLVPRIMDAYVKGYVGLAKQLTSFKSLISHSCNCGGRRAEGL